MGLDISSMLKDVSKTSTLKSYSTSGRMAEGHTIAIPTSGTDRIGDDDFSTITLAEIISGDGEIEELSGFSIEDADSVEYLSTEEITGKKATKSKKAKSKTTGTISKYLKTFLEQFKSQVATKKDTGSSTSTPKLIYSTKLVDGQEVLTLSKTTLEKLGKTSSLKSTDISKYIQYVRNVQQS